MAMLVAFIKVADVFFAIGTLKGSSAVHLPPFVLTSISIARTHMNVGTAIVANVDFSCESA